MGGEHTFKVGHVGPDIRVQGVDDHLAVGRTGDLNATVDQPGSRRRTLPRVILTDVLGLGQEVEQVALVNLGLTIHPTLEEGLASRVKGPVQDGQEGTRILGEDLASFIADGAQDGDVLELSLDVRHVVVIYLCVWVWV